jgi:hypothetical protein
MNLTELATQCGARFENWLTNPPRPRLLYFTPDQLTAFVERIREEERARLHAHRPMFIRLAEAVEAAGARRGRAGQAPSDYGPEIAALVNAIDSAIREARDA